MEDVQLPSRAAALAAFERMGTAPPEEASSTTITKPLPEGLAEQAQMRRQEFLVASVPEIDADGALFHNASDRRPDPMRPYDAKLRLPRHPLGLSEGVWQTVLEATDAIVGMSEKNAGAALVALVYDYAILDSRKHFDRVLAVIKANKQVTSSDSTLWDELRTALVNICTDSLEIHLRASALMRYDPFERFNLRDLNQRQESARMVANELYVALSSYTSRKPLSYVLWRLANVPIPDAKNISQLDKTPAEKRFYNMKQTQNIEDLNVDVFYVRDPGACPLWDKYSHARLLSAGAFGFTMRYTRRIAEAALGYQDYVAKFQRLTMGTDDLQSVAYVELRCLYEVNLLTRHWSRARRALPYNHLHLFDWVRCRFDVTTRVTQFLGEEDRKVIARFDIPGERIYQIIVEEFATGGSLAKALYASKAAFDRFAAPRAFAAMVAQIFGALSVWGYHTDFCHGDLKPDNILIQPVELSTPLTHLAYALPETWGMLYVPLVDCGMNIYKIADMGMSSITALRAKSATSERLDEVAKVGSMPTSSKWRPGIDMTTFFAMFIYSAVRHYGVNYRNFLHPDVLSLIQLGMRGNTTHETDARHRYEASVGGEASSASRLGVLGDNKLYVLAANRDILRRSLSATLGLTTKDLMNACVGLYHAVIHNLASMPAAPEDGPSALEALFAHRIFDAYRTPPAGVSNNTILDMSDYRVTAPIENPP